MKNLDVYIEINGQMRLVGHIKGEDFRDARFSYDQRFLESEEKRAISLSLPLQGEAFTPFATECFFGGLLPEGFSRKAAARWAHVDEDDYLSVLGVLGRECLGAVQICVEHEEMESSYRKLSEGDVYALASEGATKSTEMLVESHISLAGATGKVGLFYDTPSGEWYQPIGTSASTHIVKQSHVRLNQLVLNEQLCMETARLVGIQVPDSFIIDTGDKSGESVLYATERYDRKRRSDKLESPLRLHQEDFAQAMGIPSIEKYEKSQMHYMKRMFDTLNRYSADPISDRLRLWDLIVFNYLIGNTDSHIKNYSLLYSSDLKKIRLAPAYDILCTRIYGSRDEMSMFIGDELSWSSVDDLNFKKAANDIGMGKIAMERYAYLKVQLPQALELAAVNLNSQGFICVNDLKEKIKAGIQSKNG